MNEWKRWAKKVAIWLALTVISPIAAIPYWYAITLAGAFKNPPGILSNRRSIVGGFQYNLEWSLSATLFWLPLIALLLIYSLYLSLPILVAGNALQYSILKKFIQNKALLTILSISLSGIVFIFTYYIGIKLDFWDTPFYT